MTKTKKTTPFTPQRLCHLWAGGRSGNGKPDGKNDEGDEAEDSFGVGMSGYCSQAGLS